MMIEVGHLFADIPTTLLAERFDTLLNTEACRLERIVSIGHATASGEWYDQNGNEWVILLQGQAGLRFADEDVCIGPARSADSVSTTPATTG